MMVITQLFVDDDVDELIVKIFDENSEVLYLHAHREKANFYIAII